MYAAAAVCAHGGTAGLLRAPHVSLLPFAKHLRDAREDRRTRAGITCIECGRQKPYGTPHSLTHYALNSRIGSTRDSAHDTDSTCTLDDTCELLAYDPRVDAARLPERRDIVARDRGEPASRELIARERIEDRA